MRPRVIHTIETAEPGGAEKILAQVADGLRDEFEPMGVVLQKGWTSTELERLNISVAHMPLNRSFDLSWLGRMVGFIRKHNVRLIHSHEFTTNAYSVIAARLAKIPVICTIHGKNYYPDRYYRRLASRQTARFADEFVAVSCDLGTFLTRKIGIPNNRVRVIHNGIDTNEFDARHYNKAELRILNNIQENAFVIIVVAALFEMKGHRDLITALGSLDSSMDDVCILFVGEGPYQPALQKLTDDVKIGKKIRFAGFRSDIAELLALSDLFVLPSYSEGLPVSVLEAMSAGVPVIATDVGGLKEVARNGMNAFLVHPADPGELADKIMFCMDNPERTAGMAAQARKDIVTGFSIETMLDCYRRLYSGLLAS